MTARTATLTDELVERVTGFSLDVRTPNNANLFKACKDASLKGLKYHRFGRTNQFNVRNSLDGLVEKFYVQGKELLSHALEERLDDLKGKKHTKFLPEVLSLLLLLSDRPAEADGVEALKLVTAPDLSPPLTWQELIADSPITQEEIWNAPDYASSNEEETQALSQASQDTGLSSIEDDQVDLEALLIPSDHTAFDQLKSELQWRKREASQPISELHIVRESIHMLRGLPSILYDKTSRSKKLVPNHDIKMHGTSDSTVHSLLSTLADVGTTVASLRVFVSKYRKSPLLQTFCATVQEVLREFDKTLSTLESEFVQPFRPVVVSLLHIEASVQQQVTPFIVLNEVIVNAQTPSLSASLQSPGKVPTLDAQPHRLLDFLYEETCDAHASSKYDVFQRLMYIFFACLETYLRPVHDWMQHGNLTEDPNFPIALLEMETPITTGLSTFWYDRFAIRQSHIGRPEAPRFLYPHLSKILGSGKSVAFCLELGLEASSSSSIHDTAIDTSSLSFMHTINPEDLIPFGESFAYHLNDHIDSLYKHTSREIVHHLLHRDAGIGLLQVITALKIVYLSSNGVLFDSFAGDIYAAFSNSETTSGLPSSLMIKACAQRSFGEADSVKPASISASIDPLAIAPGQTPSISKRLAQIQISYIIPPSMQNIIVPKSSMAMYSAVLRLLLQLRYSLMLVRPVVFFRIHPQTQRLIHYIRHRLLHALSSLEDYIFNLVISPAISALDKRFLEAQDVDELISAHEAFTHDISTGCFEAGKITEGLRRIITALCDLGVLFAQAVERCRNGDESIPSSTGNTREDTPGAVTAETDHMDGRKSATQAASADLSIRNDAARTHTLSRLRHIRVQVVDLLSMLVAQLRSVSRSGGSSTGSMSMTAEGGRWEMLADRLH